MYQKFENLLKERKVTAYQVSKATGIPQGVLATWKKRNGGMSYKNLALLSDYFRVPLEYWKE